MKIIDTLLAQSKISLTIIGIFVVILIGLVDYYTGWQYSLSVIYLVPILLVAWFVGRRAGIVLSIVSMISYLTVELSLNTPYETSVLAYWVNSTIRLTIFLIVTFVLLFFRNTLAHEKGLARTDDLTGVANRRFFFESATGEIIRVNRSKASFTVAYMDIDNFKLINDGFGHGAGDALLRSVARIIQNQIRAIDLVARLGGDEFAILMPETGEEAGQVVIRRVQFGLNEYIQKNKWPISFSIGVVTFTRAPVSADEMMKKADDLMYSVKNEGKNMIRYEVFQKVNS